jgi:hypothetical protein
VDGRKALAIFVILAILLFSRYYRSSYASGSASAIFDGDSAKTGWTPKWNVAEDKSRPPKSNLKPIVAFADPGFHGSPAPQDKESKKKEVENREKFASSFEGQPECFGITLARVNPSDADFNLQIFNGIDGHTGRWQWVLYSMDTLGAKASGEATGANTIMGTDAMVKSVCNSIHNSLSQQGGRVN